MSSSTIPIPTIALSFFANFPLYTHPPILTESDRNHQNTNFPSLATLWILPPKPDIVLPSTNLLSEDVECLKWQAYIALRFSHRTPAITNTSELNTNSVALRWDVSEDGGVDGRLPALQTNERKLLAARAIPGWVDKILGQDSSNNNPLALEGYNSEAARDESRAWVALLEGVVHTALTLSRPPSPTFTSLLFQGPSAFAAPSLNRSLAPPPAPSLGFTSLFPSYGGERVSLKSIQTEYHDAIVSLSDRLGQDEWFLGSAQPTPLDALAFAYIHCLLNGPDSVRLDLQKRTNLVSWERKVHVIVQSAFVSSDRQR